MKKLIWWCSVLFVTAVPTFAGDEAPAWLRQAASNIIPIYAKDVPAVVLRDESTMTVGEDGRVTTVSTYAVRILNREGRGYASATEQYETDRGKVRDMHAWMIRPSGQVKSYGKDRVIDEAELNDVYDESRLKIIEAGGDADVGSVFGYQITSENRSFFNQTVWHFQGTLPVLSSHLTVVLPQGWHSSSITFNHERIEPTVTGSSYSWELHSLQPIEREPASPTVRSLAPRVAISYYPPSPNANAALGNFGNWTDVSRWYSELSDTQAAPGDALASKARELTVNAKTDFERIQAIGRYIQNLQYISIQIGIGRFRPHAATQVFAKSYGDCKDKANLMRAMLRAVKLQAYPVLIRSGDATYVREEWVSPGQFNHCIVAIKVGDDTQAPTVLQHPILGRLLIFDPTDDDTPVGDLPDDEQGSFALIAAGDRGTLVRMPVTPPEANQLWSQSEVSLDANGSIAAKISTLALGQSAVSLRREFRHLSRPEYNKLIEGWISHGANGATVSKVEPQDQSGEGRFSLNVEFSAANYGQLMQGHLLIFRAAIVSRRQTLPLTSEARKQPIVLESNAYTDTVSVKLPDGFDVDEMPDPVKLETPFGSYSSSYKAQDGKLVFTRKLVLHAGTIPREQYAKVRGFFEGIRSAEQNPVVLAKK